MALTTPSEDNVNSDVFKNDNAFATVNQAMTAAQNRLRMVARNIAENFMKEVIEGIYCLARANDNKPFTVENFMGVQQVIPKKHWPEEMEVCIEVAIGQSEKANYANSLIQAFQMLSQAPMLAGSAFTTQNAHYLAYNAMKYMGIRDIPYALTPMSQVQPPQPDPMAQKAKELELAKIESEVMEKQAAAQDKQASAMEKQVRAQMDQQKLMFEQQVAADDFKLRVQDFMSKGQREADRTTNEQYENQIKMLREQLEAQMKTSDLVAKQEEAADKLHLEQQKLALEAEALRIQRLELELKAMEIQTKMRLEQEKLMSQERLSERQAAVQTQISDKQLNAQLKMNDDKLKQVSNIKSEANTANKSKESVNNSDKKVDTKVN